ncbi:MAG: GIY-YIG nuclease family protein [Patescibacteria group bacterium]|nr:GIY-YIG nuclease family protein [Patescibacteria group bacterium]
MFYVYILFSHKDKNLYIGFTANLKIRLRKHQGGEVFSTKPRRPLDLIYYEAHKNKYDALRREKYFKTSKGKSTIYTMLRENLKKIK